MFGSRFAILGSVMGILNKDSPNDSSMRNTNVMEAEYGVICNLPSTSGSALG